MLAHPRVRLSSAEVPAIAAVCWPRLWQGCVGMPDAVDRRSVLAWSGQRDLMLKSRRARSRATRALATQSCPSALVGLALWASAQHAHAADAASRQQDRADFGSNISYSAFPIYRGGTADARSVRSLPSLFCNLKSSCAYIVSE